MLAGKLTLLDDEVIAGWFKGNIGEVKMVTFCRTFSKMYMATPTGICLSAQSHF